MEGKENHFSDGRILELEAQSCKGKNSGLPTVTRETCLLLGTNVDVVPPSRAKDQVLQTFRALKNGKQHNVFIFTAVTVLTGTSRGHWNETVHMCGDQRMQEGECLLGSFPVSCAGPVKKSNTGNSS